MTPKLARLAPLAPALAVALLGLSVPAAAQDHTNLDELRPTSLEDAYPVAVDEVILETGVQFVDEHNQSTRYEVPFRLVWGADPRVQVEVGSYVATDAHDILNQHRPGDVHAGVLYVLNEETDDEPAVSGKLSANVPSGGDSHGFDFEVKGLASKSFNEHFRGHLNAVLRLFAGESSPERNSQWNVTLGATHDVDMFEETPTTLIADVYLEQSKLEKDDQTFGLELGTRHQVDEDRVLDVGIARDLSGARDRDDFRMTVGVSVGLGHS